MRWWRRAVFAALGLPLAAAAVRAHEVSAERFVAPLPLPALYVGAGLTVAATAVLLAAAGAREVDATRTRRAVRLPPDVARILRASARTVFFAAFVAAVAAGVLDRQVRAENFATVFVWPVWLTGVALVAAVFGSPWRVLSPWRTIYDALVRLEGEEVAALGDYPEWLGAWPALLGFLVWPGVLATLTVLPRSPRATTAVVAGYAAVMVAGAVAFGPVWFRRADALDVLYRLFGRVAPLPVRRTNDGALELTLRPPWRACTVPVAGGVLATFVVVALYTASFDGFANTPEYQTVVFAAREATGLGPVASVPLYLAGGVGFVAAFLAVSWAAERVVDGDDWRGAALAVAPTLLPIAAAYEVAHSYPWVVENLGRAVTVVGGYVAASPPSVEPLGWLSLPAFWASQVALIVGGHLVAVVASHSVVVRRYGAGGQAQRAHLPLALLMVGYTVLSLWIVSRPVVS